MHIVPPPPKDPLARVDELLQGQTHDYLILQPPVPGHQPCIAILRLNRAEIGRGKGDSPRVAREGAARAALPALEQRHKTRKAQQRSFLGPEQRLAKIFRYRMGSFLDWVIEYRLATPKQRKCGIRFILSTRRQGPIYITIKERTKNDNAGYFLWNPRIRVIALVPYDPYLHDDELFDRFHEAFRTFYAELKATPLLAPV
ncbi:hypothetical protein KBB27_01165 [Patescibacteria group bacterium]|nr:hypothetical protein [Patescibacteria group bacterium]